LINGDTQPESDCRDERPTDRLISKVDLKRRASTEPTPDRLVGTRLFDHEIAELDHRADAVGLSRSAFLRGAILADADACDVLRAKITALEAHRTFLTARVAELEAQLASTNRRHARDAAELRGWRDGAISSVAERCQIAEWHAHG
jgi:hypothetical protein